MQLPDQYGVDQQAIERRRQMAQALMQQSQQPLPNGQMVGRVFVGTNPLQHLAQGLRGYSASKQLESADADQKALAGRQQARNQQDMQGVIAALRGTPSFQTPANEMGDETVMQNAVPGDPARAGQIAMGSQNPQLQQLGMGMLKDQLTPQKPMVVGRSLVDPKTGKVIGTDETWKQEQADAREAKILELAQKAADQRAAQQERLEAQKQLRQMGIDAQQAMARLVASMRVQPQPQIVTNEQGVFQVGRDGTAMPVMGPDGQPITGKPKLEKALPSPTAKRLEDQAVTADSTKRFAATFKPEFGGKTIAGELSNTTKRVLGDDTGQAQWWQDYAFHRNKVRNDLFGSALTATEQAEWNKADINPRMEPKQIRLNLERRAELEQRALARQIKANEAAGYNKEQIRALTGQGGDAAPTGFKIIGVK